MTDATHPRRDRWWDGVALVGALVTLGAHLRHIIQDGRVPRDPGLYYQDTPIAAAAWADLPGGAGELMAMMVQPSGWYNALLGLVQALMGPSPMAFRAFELLSMTGILVGVWAILRPTGGRTAATGVLLTAAMPVIIILGRTPWIHHPEAALILLAAAALLADRALVRWRTVAIVGGLGVLAIALRASALGWVGTLAVVALAPGAPRRWPRIGALLGSWAAAALIPLLHLQRYLDAKAESRAGYIERLPELGPQVVEVIGFFPLLVVFVGVIAYGFHTRRQLGATHALAGGWVVLTFVLWLVFRAGMDNFPLLAPALAIIGALGYADGLWAGTVAAAEVAVLMLLPQLWPAHHVRPVRLLPFTGQLAGDPHRANHYRSWSGFTAADLRALVDATCPAEARAEPCIVLAAQGLMIPYGEEPGRLELFLTGLSDRVALQDGRAPAQAIIGQDYAAMAAWDCGGRSAEWALRFPQADTNAATIVQLNELEPAWSRRVDAECTVLWLTPGGAVPQPDALPTRVSTHIDHVGEGPMFSQPPKHHAKDPPAAGGPPPPPGAP